jgi:hypothetical protein
VQRDLVENFLDKICRGWDDFVHFEKTGSLCISKMSERTNQIISAAFSRQILLDFELPLRSDPVHDKPEFPNSQLFVDIAGGNELINPSV